MKMEHYLCHTDYPIWQVIQNGNGPVSVTIDINGMIKVLPPKTAAEEMWKAIKSRFGDNDESKKMQKYLLKQQFKCFSMSVSEGCKPKVSKVPTFFLVSVALIMRTKLGLDTLSFNDLYNNLRVFERDVKGTTASSSSNTQNVVFVFANNISSTNDVSTAYSVSSPSVSKSQKEGPASYNDEVIHYFFTNQSSAHQLDCDDLEQINDDDLEEMDLKWQTKVECFNCHKMGHFARDCRAKGNQDSRRRDGGYNGNKARDNSRRPAYKDDSKALVTIMERLLTGLDMVQSCSKACVESYARLKKIYDEQRDKLGDASVEITAYTLALKKVEARLLCHQQNQLAYEQKIKFMKIDLDDKTDVVTYHKKLLAEALKEKEDLKTKVENWKNSSKNLNRLLNTQMSANDKFRLGHGDYRYGSILSYENEVLQSVFKNKECDLENTLVNDRYAKGMHTVPPLMTGNYMPSGTDVEIDYSKFTYGSKQTSADESDSKPIEYASSESDSSEETTTSMPAPVDNAPKIIYEPKVWTDAPIIEEYESNSDDDSVSIVQENIEKPSFAFTDSIKHVKSPREIIKEIGTPNHYPKIEKQNRHSHTRKGLGYAFTRKSCFVCGSFSHLIRDCDFHEKRMAKQATLTKSKEKVNGQPAHRLDDPHKALKDKGIIDSGCSRHMTGNKAHLVDYQEFKGGFIAFGGSNGKITGKGKIKVVSEITQEVLNVAAGGIFLYKTPNQAYQLLEDKVLLKLDSVKNKKNKPSLKKTVAFVDEGSSNSNTDKIMARMNAMTLKMDAQNKELQYNAKKANLDLDEDDIPMSREEEAKFMQTFRKTCFYNDYRDRDTNRDNWHSNDRNNYNLDNYRSNTDDKSYDLQKQFNDFMKSQQSTNAFVKETFMDLKTQLETIANHQASI
nr:ribonuclease H-like domain-containing protein [Tanacetum cinerariifolium]